MRLASPFLLRSVTPPLRDLEGRRILGFSRIGKLLADRSLSRLLEDDWPRTLEELEALKRGHRAR